MLRLLNFEEINYPFGSVFQYVASYSRAYIDSPGGGYCKSQFVVRIVSTQLMMTTVQVILTARGAGPSTTKPKMMY